MAERIVNGYKRLFEVRLLHHYWLDEGGIVFDAITPATSRDKRLLTYDIRPYLNVRPTLATEKALKGLGCIFKQTALGFVVVAPGQAVVPADSVFEFPLIVENAVFKNVSILSMRSQKIYEILHLDKIFRYKEGVFVLSNSTGSKRTLNAESLLFLSKPIPALNPIGAYQVESLVEVGGSIRIVTADNTSPPPVSSPIGQSTQLPVYVHQGDIPPTVPPLGLNGAPAFGIELNDQIPDDVFALVRIVAADTGDAEFNITDGSNHPKTPHPVFQARFHNRWTVRKYYNKSTQAFIPPQTSLLPMTAFGNAGAKQKPPPEAVSATLNSAEEITEIFSEIFE